MDLNTIALQDALAEIKELRRRIEFLESPTVLYMHDNPVYLPVQPRNGDYYCLDSVR